MSHTVMVTGVEDPGSETLHLENIPHCEMLIHMKWTRLSVIATCLLSKMHGTGLDVTTPAILEAYRKLCGAKMIWVSSVEHCINEDRLPTDPRAEVFLPKEHANCLLSVFLCKALITKFECSAAVGSPAQ